MTAEILLENRIPTSLEHRRIAEAVGWAEAFDWHTTPLSLQASLSGVVAVVEGQAVGMGRVIGDGVKYFYIQDVAVLPTHQGVGLGQAIVDRLLAQIAASAPSPAFVGLFSTDQAMDLYSSRGFAAGNMTGLFRLVEPAPAVQ